MKLTNLLIIVNFIPLCANVYSQHKTFSLSMSDVTIKELFSNLEEKTGYKFLYRDDSFENMLVSINAENQSLDAILQDALLNTNSTYRMLDNNLIVIIPAEMRQQGLPITGTVTDASTGESLVGVNVLIEGTTQGTVTDNLGKYNIVVPDNAAVLVFSYIGYAPRRVATANITSIDIELEPEFATFDEVVVIGYGTQTKRDVSGSLVSVSEKNFNSGVSRDAVDLLQGKVAGLVITSGSGDVTTENTIRLRGTSSLTGSSTPFVVVDGVPGASLGSVAPQDIASISILKDASAGAIYGSRSASGVILITTKKGKSGKLSVDYDGYVAFDKVTNKPDVLTADEWRNYCTDNSIDVTGIDLGYDTDWFGEIMRTGVSTSHGLSFSGGTEKSNYRASLSYLERQGVVKDNDLNRFIGRVSFEQKALNDRLTLGLTTSITQKDYSPTYANNFVLAYNMLPVWPVKNDDGSWFESEEYDQGNPLHNIEENTSINKNSLYFGNLKADLEVYKGLVASLNLFKQRETNDYSQYYHSETEAGRNDNGLAQKENYTRDKDLLEFILNYKIALAKHNLELLGGYSYEENNYQLAGARNKQFVTNMLEYNDLEAGENLENGDVWSERNMNKLISFFGRINYNLSDKYLLTATLRRDGSSKFGKNNKWGTFPSVSVAWRLNQETFLNNLSYLNELKLRVGYGVTGNQDGIDPYQSLALYGSSGQYYDNGSWFTAYEYAQNANPNLKWEETEMYNIGLDFGLFENRINGTIDYYSKTTNDLLYEYEVPVPPYLYETMLANVGSMSNKGVEIILNGDIIRKNDLGWTLSINFARNKNKITSLSNEEFSTAAIKTGDAWIRGGSDNTTSIIEEGKEVGTFYGWKCYGLDETGNYIMDETIDGEAGLSDNDRTYIGTAQPKFTYGISNTLVYKNFDLTFFLRGVYGNDVLNFSKMSYGTTQWLPGANVLSDALTSGLTATPKYCSYYIEKGSFLRMDNASLGYTVKVRNLYGIERLKLYVAGQNLFVLTNYEGLDPEVDMSGLAPGIEGRTYYPKTRTITLGIRASF